MVKTHWIPGQYHDQRALRQTPRQCTNKMAAMYHSHLDHIKCSLEEMGCMFPVITQVPVFSGTYFCFPR